MRGGLLLALLLGAPAAAAVGCAAEEEKMSAQGTPSAQVPPARDGDVAIQEELDAARRAGSLEAYDLFIARHPGHRLATVAREERARIAGGGERRR